MDTTLHIGTGKTGTSSLQLFLHANRELLAENGVLYTKSLGATNNVEIAKYGLNSSEFDKSFYFQNKGVKTKDGKNKFDERVVEKLNVEINSAKRRGIKKVIISSEHFATDLRDINNIKRIKDLFEIVGINVKTVVVYIREQSSYIFSDYNTRILMGEYKYNTPNIPSSENNSVLNHAHTIKIWAKSFVDAEINVRIFEKEKLINGNSVDDFISLAGLREITDFKYTKANNESLSGDALAFLVKYNRHVAVHSLSSELSIIIPEIRNTLINLCREYFPGESLKPTENIKKIMRDLFEKSNEEVRREYFPTQEHLFICNEREIEKRGLGINQGEIGVIGYLLMKLIKS
jgi:hypothetical protein